ncbi:hypothetical protein P3S67_008209 [Capsicum chacoense]
MTHASVASLMRTIESLLTSNSPIKSLICDHREELCALHEKTSSLEVFIKNFEKNNVSGEMTDFEEQVKEVANIVEQTIQLSVTEVVLANDKNLREKAHERLSDRLQQGKHASKESTVQEFPSSSKNILNVENSMVGRDDQRKRLVEDLTRSYSGEPKVIPIVGMGGIGKTTLANKVYNDACIRSHFDVCAWATISQQHNVKEILLSLLHCTKDVTFDMDNEAELANMLQKSLKGKRYLIVLDDMWKSEAWDAVRLCFPSENKGSRILLTTRNTEVARDAGTENLSLQMDIMGPDESWNLFKSVAYANEALSYEFETIGKKIAKKCHGLPLTIAVVAGLLKFKRAIEDWENVAKDVKSFVTNDPDERCSRVLGLSYNHLTSVLKTCLLHFEIFPEDSEIPAKNLMRSWMAEGFLKLENDLEGEAEKCLQELVDRCLVLVCKKSLDGTKIRSCKVHDLIYDLCVREIQRENIFITNNIVLDLSGSESPYLSMQIMQPFKPGTGDKIGYCHDGLYRALLTPVHRQLRDHDNNDLLKRTRSIFSFHLKDLYHILKLELIHFKLLKVLELRQILIDVFPLHILSLIWLRASQTAEFYLPNPPSVSADKGSHIGFSHIQTISYLSMDCCAKEVIMGIQNVKELGLSAYWIDSDGLLNNLVHLQQLETLSLTYCLSRPLPASAKAFPATLKKLKLERTWLSWSYLDIIAELPNLEVLKLMVDACDSEEWHPNVRGFTRLRLLLIEENFLQYWKAIDDNFPVLEHLVLKECIYLKEIPIEFAEIPTLQLIELGNLLQEFNKNKKSSEMIPWMFASPIHVVRSHHNDDDDEEEEEEDSDVDVAEDDDDSDVDVAEDGDSDAAKHDDNYDLNWLFDVQNNLALLTPVHRQLRDHDALPDENFVTSLTHTNDDNSPLRRIHSIFLFAAPSLSTNSNFKLGHLNLISLGLELIVLLRFSAADTFSHFVEEIKQLRYLNLRSFYLPDPPSSSIDGERNLIWSNIQSVSGLLPYCCTEEVISGIQNIKKLCIWGHVCDYDMREEVMDIREIVDLQQLETLSIKVDRYHVSHWSSRSHKSTVCVPNATYFPTELKKLKLVGTRLAWEDLNIIGQWPNLEVLKQKPNACRGLEWRPIEGGFHRSELHYC